MHWIYLSPHYDDAVLSCGGMIWEQTQAGDTVEIWTICAASPPAGHELPPFAQQMHAEWQLGRNAPPLRRIEDREACARVGASATRYWRLPDCIYRRLSTGEEVVRSGPDIWAPIHPGEMHLVRKLRGWLQRRLPTEARLVSPLTLGNHLDHRIVRAAVESLRRELHYYADFPYVAQNNLWLPVGLGEEQLYRRQVSPEGFAAWQNGVAAYASQISSLFVTMDEMHRQLRDFWQAGGGSFLWKP